MSNFSPVFYARFINQTLRKIPLRFVLIVPFVLQITATVSIISYLFFLSGQRAIEKMSSELMDEVTQRVEDHLQKLTETAETITNLTLDHWEIENIDFKNLNLPEHQLFLIIQTFKSISRISLGNEQHDFVSVTRSKGERLLRSSPQDSSLIYDYAIDHNGKIIRLLRTFKKPSVTLAPWYQDAVKTRKTSWSDFYKIGSQEDFGFSLNTPIYHRITGELLGVFSVEIVSSDLSNFLRNIHLGQSGQVILINRQGDLVARSLGKTYQQDSQEFKKINLLSSRDLLLNHIGKFLIKNFGSLLDTKTLQNVNFIIPPTMLGSLSNHYFLQVFPLKDKYGLDLIAIIVIPKSNFMAEVNTYLKQTFVLSCGIFCLSIVVGILTSRWIIKPILAVNQAAKRIAEGEIQNLSDFERSDEIGELVQSFKGMNTELQTTLVNLKLEILKHKKTEQSLKVALEQIQQHFDNSPLAIIEWDAQGKIKRWSKHAEKIFGWKADEVIGLSNDDFCLISEEDREKVAQGIQQMISGKVSTLKIQNCNYTKTGEILVCEWFSSGLFDQQGNLTSTLSFVQDVTPRQQSEEALRQSEQRFERAIKGSNDGIWDWFNVNQEQIWYSPRFFEIIGYQPNEFEPTFTQFINFIHPDDRQRVFQDIENHLRFNLPYLTEYRWLHKLGYYIWVQVRGEALRDEQGNPVSMAGSLRDITEQKVAELALRRSEAKWQHLIAANIVGILFTDFEGGIVEANDAFLQMLGYSREELETQQLNLNVMIPNHSQDVYQQMLQKILTDKVLPLHENKYLHKNGTQIPVIVGITLLEEVHQVVSFVLDLSQQKQTEFELQKAKEQAEMASRAKSTFLTNMSHELRTPLNAILGFTQLMVRDKTLASHHREKLNIVNRNGEHLLELINDILSISKIEANRITLEEKIFNLYQFVEDLKDTFELRATSKGLQLMVERSPNLPQYLQTDERKLRQVLINLFDNAIKFTDQGSITLKIQPLDPIPNPVSNPSDYRIQFQVQDTGEGMAPEELKTIFDAFVQTSSGQKFEQGIGLGLPISRRFVELMGGKITVHSQLGIGTCFEFTIRVQPIDSANLTYLQPQYQVIGLDPHQPQYRILVVEDSEAHRQWLTKLLRSVGFDVMEANNGEEALNLVESYNPHLIWMDMRMSGMNGYQATQKIRAKKAKTLLTTPPNFSPFPKIIAVSASVFEEERQKVVAAGCDDFVGKPLTENLIWEMLKKHLGVKFRVEGSQLHKAEHHEIQDSIIVQALTTLPPELLNQLAMETQIGDSEKFLSLLAQIPPSQTFLINTLTELINNFEFELILHWVKLALS